MSSSALSDRYVHACVRKRESACESVSSLSPLVRVVRYISFICEEDYGILKPMIHSQF